MSTLPRSVLGGAAIVSALAGVAPASVWTVDGAGGGDFLTISAAVAAAADGDVVVVRAGAYPAFDVVGKSVVVRAQAGHVVDVFGRTRVLSLAANQQVQLAGLRFNAWNAPNQPALLAQSNAGPLVLFECTFQGANGTPTYPTMHGREGAVLEGNASVIAVAATFTGGTGASTDPWIGGGGDGLRVWNGPLVLLDSSLFGGLAGEDFDGDENGGRGGHGLAAVQAQVSAARTTAVGGHGGYGGFSDLTQMCRQAGAGGDGVALTLGATLADMACVWTPGARGTFACGPEHQPPPTGAQVSGGSATALEFSPYCFGVASRCPCDNVGFGPRGCDVSFGTGGGRLSPSGSALVLTDTLALHVDGLPPAGTAILFQGTAFVGTRNAGSVFGDGLRCAGGNVMRLASHPVVSGGATFGPAGGDPPISIAGQIPPGGGERSYQVWFRNALAFCTASTFNLTHGLRVLWRP